MKYVYKVWLWFEHVLDIKWTKRHFNILAGALTGVSILALFLIGYNNVIRVRNDEIKAQRKVATAQQVSAKVEELNAETFANELLVSEDYVFDTVRSNPSSAQVQRYMVYLASMYDGKSVEKARSVLPWKDGEVSSSVRVSDTEAYTSKIATPVSVAKTYGSTFETYIGQFDVVAVAKNGNKLKTRSAVTLTFSEGVIVAWSLSERNLQ